MLRVSCLELEIKEVRCYEVKIEKSEKGRQPPGLSQTQDTSGIIIDSDYEED